MFLAIQNGLWTQDVRAISALFGGLGALQQQPKPKPKPDTAAQEAQTLMLKALSSMVERMDRLEQRLQAQDRKRQMDLLPEASKLAMALLEAVQVLHPNTAYFVDDLWCALSTQPCWIWTSSYLCLTRLEGRTPNL